VKKPVRKSTHIDKNKVLIAVADEKAKQEIKSLLESAGYAVLTSPDGVDAMITAVKELPSMAILDVALPKIYGFEVCKRLKGREETKDMKVILYTSFYDKNRYKRQPTSLYGADDYIEGFDVQNSLVKKVRALYSGESAATTEQAHAQKEESPAVKTTAVRSGHTEGGEWEVKARRLARTVLSDIFLYNPQKAEDAVKSGNFLHIFASEVKEGKKLYDSRIPKDIRDLKDFFHDEIDNFLEERRKRLNS
jgi:DNA-binding response OmpR family regulator